MWELPETSILDGEKFLDVAWRPDGRPAGHSTTDGDTGSSTSSFGYSLRAPDVAMQNNSRCGGRASSRSLPVQLHAFRVSERKVAETPWASQTTDRGTTSPRRIACRWAKLLFLKDLSLGSNNGRPFIGPTGVSQIHQRNGEMMNFRNATHAHTGRLAGSVQSIRG